MTEQTAREVLGLLLTLASLGVAAVAYAGRRFGGAS